MPAFGPAMQLMEFIFLKRNWSEDSLAISHQLSAFKAAKYPLQLLIFPEGTNLSPHTKSRSDAYCKEIGVAPFGNVLFPRVKGFALLIRSLRKTVDCVYDITMAYPDVIPVFEADLLFGKFPREVTFPRLGSFG